MTSSFMIVNFFRVGFASTFFILFSLLTISIFTRFRRLSMDFPYTLFDMSLKKSFSKSDVAAFLLFVLNSM